MTRHDRRIVPCRATTAAQTWHERRTVVLSRHDGMLGPRVTCHPARRPPLRTTAARRLSPRIVVHAHRQTPCVSCAAHQWSLTRGAAPAGYPLPEAPRAPRAAPRSSPPRGSAPTGCCSLVGGKVKRQGTGVTREREVSSGGVDGGRERWGLGI